VRVLREGGDGPGRAALAAGEGLVVHERGLRFRVDPGLGEPEHPRPGTGLYLDQRENRERLARLARGGGRWLNLFAHTGAFSVALLAAGAEEVTSVDLSGAYLRWLEENLALNAEMGVDAARHHGVRRDGRRHLGTLPRGERFDGIVLDPPTAAAAGRRFWSAARDLEPLVAEALGRLSPGGVLLVCRNERRAKRALRDVVRRAAEHARVRVGAVREAGPGADFPHRPGFPEGDSFQGAIVQRS
jgi:23S rRNA G2069 N7-methylase RlmK/C1962 C5-methylase RlmI